MDGGTYAARTVSAHAAACFHVTRGIASLADLRSHQQVAGVSLLAMYLRPGARIDTSECVKVLRDVALDGLFEYLDEQLASRNAVFGLLTKYKQRSEWFTRRDLLSLATADTHGRAGERALARDLHRYLLDQGVDFTIEPTSGSGEVDLLLRDSDGRYVIVDAKYIDSKLEDSKLKSKLSNGFHQVYRYCEDFNEPSGFLVPFLVGSRRLALELQEADGLRFLTIGSKTIYYLEIAIGAEPAASRSGRPNELAVSAADLKSVSGGTSGDE